MELSVISSTLAVTLSYNNAILTSCGRYIKLGCPPVSYQSSMEPKFRLMELPTPVECDPREPQIYVCLVDGLSTSRKYSSPSILQSMD